MADQRAGIRTELQLSPELTAIATCVEVLEGLPEEAQARALTYLAARFGNFVRPAGRAAGQLGRIQAGRRLDDDTAKPQHHFG